MKRQKAGVKEVICPVPVKISVVVSACYLVWLEADNVRGMLSSWGTSVPRHYYLTHSALTLLILTPWIGCVRALRLASALGAEHVEESLRLMDSIALMPIVTYLLFQLGSAWATRWYCGEWPIQTRLWLEWGLSTARAVWPTTVIPTGWAVRA